MPYIGRNFEKSDCKVLIIVDEVKDFADFKKSKYDNYCQYLIEKNGAVQKILEQYDLKKDDVACYNYRYNCKVEIKLEKLKGKELTEYNNELKNCINELKPKPEKIIVQREQIKRNVAKRKKYFDSGKITFEKFLENKGIELVECRKDGKQGPFLIIKLRTCLNVVDHFLKMFDLYKEFFIKGKKKEYDIQSEIRRKVILSSKELDELYNLSRKSSSSNLDKYDALVKKICNDFGVPFPADKAEWNSEYQFFLDKINHKLNCYCDYRCFIDELQKALFIVNKLECNSERNKVSFNKKNEVKNGKCLIVFTNDKKKTLDFVVDKCKKKYKINECNFCFFNYIDEFDLLYFLKEKNCQNLTESPLSWYNKKLVKFIVENKPSTVVFCGGLLRKTIFKNKIPSINKKIEEFLIENNISYFTEDFVTRENPSTKKSQLIQIKSLVEQLQDVLNCLNPCNSAGELVFFYNDNDIRHFIPESALHKKRQDELHAKCSVPDLELEKYDWYHKADETLQKAIKKVNEAVPRITVDGLTKVRRMIPLLEETFVPLPMFFELLDSIKYESDFPRVESLFSDLNGVKIKAYNDEFREKHKEKTYDKGKIKSYNIRLNHFYTRLKEEHYGYLELLTKTIFMEDQIEKIKIYQDLTLRVFDGGAWSIVKNRKKEIESDQRNLDLSKDDPKMVEKYSDNIKKIHGIIKKFGDDIAVRDGFRLEEKVREYLLNHLWKPKNP